MDAVLNLWKNKVIRNWAPGLAAVLVLVIRGFSSANASNTEIAEDELPYLFDRF